MKVPAAIANGFSRWIDAVAGFVVALPWQFASPRTVKLIEVEDGEFTIHTPQRVFRTRFRSSSVSELSTVRSSALSPNRLRRLCAAAASS